MNITASSRRLFIGSGIYALLCAPAILLVEHLGWPQSFFHITQPFGAILCFAAACIFLWSTRGSRFNGTRWLAVIASLLSGLWLAFIVYVVMTLDFSAMD